ncbi:hypothetical protein Paride_0441 [Pseudomonas phage Paride]|nr:hypothetical protein Paride_0441 [Pseudomonas phage Paride]
MPGKLKYHNSYDFVYGVYVIAKDSHKGQYVCIALSEDLDEEYIFNEINFYSVRYIKDNFYDVYCKFDLFTFARMLATHLELLYDRRYNYFNDDL